MRILVTGALGTLGQPLVTELRGRGHEVYGCDLRHSADPGFMRADVADNRQLIRAFGQSYPEVVYHLAAEFGRHNGEEFYEDCWQTNLVGTRNVLELCRTHNTRLIFASSSEIYGECDAPVLYEALSDEVPLWQPNEYALSKWANEVQVANFQRRHGLDATRLRFFNAYGPGEAYHPYRSVVALFCHRLLHGEPIDVYDNYWRTFMAVQDFIPTLANVCEADLSHNVYNIGGVDYREVSELAEIVLAETDADPKLIRQVPEDEHNTRSKRPDISRARRDLDHNPMITLEEGVPLTLEWMRAASGTTAPLRAG